MSRSKRSPAPRRRLLFGPGTVMALLAALYLIGSGWLSPRGQQPGGAGRIVYQADSHGRLQRVDGPLAAGAPTGPAPRLWKPEVGLLLSDGAQLGLRPDQRQRIEALAASWSRDKSDMVAAMRAATGGVETDLRSARPGRGAAIPLVQRGLGDYSALSREYDARRADYWSHGLAVLTPRQRAQAATAPGRAGGGTQ